MNGIIRSCPICGASPHRARLFVEDTLDASRLSNASFASRKEPEYMSRRMVQCPRCDLVYVPTPPTAADLAAAYHSADYDSAEEADDAAATYMRETAVLIGGLRGRQRALEIGTGTGAFLQCLHNAGFAEVVGVEPSLAAIAAAPAERRAWIRGGVFDQSDFVAGSFDLICCFMTLEHVLDPMALATAAWRLLRPNGALITVTHDYRSFINRVLGRRSPILDIEHQQIFWQRSIVQLFGRTGFERISARPFANTYAVRYWWRLMPLPPTAKRMLGRITDRSRLGRMRLSLRVGNTISIGFKPEQQGT